jgi:hypothetical protein
VFSIARKVFVALLLMTISTTPLWAFNSPESNSQLERFEPADDVRLISSRFTQMDDLSLIPRDAFISLKEADELILENAYFKVFMNEETLAFKIQDQRSGYIWNTVIDDVDAGTFNPLLSSSIGFEYINLNQNFSTRQNVGLIDTEYDVKLTTSSNQIIMEITIGGFCTSRQCSRFYDEYASGNPAYDLDRMLTLGFINLDISLRVEMTLNETGIQVHVPFDSIEEGNNENVVLSSLIIFPGLGAAFEDSIPGYMVIPDGAGALIRYGNNQGRFVAPYEERFYGRNLGLLTGRSSVTNYPLTLPIFGVVHGVYQHGFVGIIESGDINATLLAFPQGASNVPYYLIYPRFDLKQTYRQSFTSDGLGGSLKLHESSHEDITLRYDFLTGNDAHYVGIGLRYQSVLKDQGILEAMTLLDPNIPLHLQFLMADSKDRFIGQERIIMTNLEAASRIHQTLYDQGLTNQRISLKGWNKGGYSGHLPASLNFENRLGSNRDFRNLNTFFETAYPIMLVNNYNFGSEATNRINYRRDVALGVNRFRLESTCERCVYQSEYFLTPERTEALALQDFDDYVGASLHVLFESMGHTLFSYDFNGSQTRYDALEHYLNVFEIYQGQASYLYPLPYVWAYTDTFFEAPLYNSQLKYFNDLVPLLSIVLSGQMEMISSFLNFNSLGRSQILRLIDFNIYPSYILTEERPSLLKGSDLERMFATEFNLFETIIVDEYTMINNALRHVKGATIVSRDVLDVGVVEVSYSNGVTLTINYGFSAYVKNGTTINAQDVLIEGGRP